LQPALPYQVAYQVGFSDQSYFDRRFKAAFGRTPRDFRLLREQLNGSSKGPRRPSRRIGAITELALQGASSCGRYIEKQSSTSEELAALLRSLIIISSVVEYSNDGRHGR
jgi:hypothetical protein